MISLQICFTTRAQTLHPPCTTYKYSKSTQMINKVECMDMIMQHLSSDCMLTASLSDLRVHHVLFSPHRKINHDALSISTYLKVLPLPTQPTKFLVSEVVSCGDCLGCFSTSLLLRLHDGDEWNFVCGVHSIKMRKKKSHKNLKNTRDVPTEFLNPSLAVSAFLTFLTLSAWYPEKRKEIKERRIGKSLKTWSMKKYFWSN